VITQNQIDLLLDIADGDIDTFFENLDIELIRVLEILLEGGYIELPDYV
jgi:hypothetical protein